jgi:hypothetical protein
VTQTFQPRGTVIHQHGHPTRLTAAVMPRRGVINIVLLEASAPNYEDARAEAIARFPDVPFTVPRLGE